MCLGRGSCAWLGRISSPSGSRSKPMAEHKRHEYWYVYIAGCPNDPDILKIGFSHNPAQRIRSQVCPDGSRPFLVRVFKFRGRNFWAEQRAHKNVAEFRVKNEWFRISEQTAVWAILRGDRDCDPRWARRRQRKQVGPLEILCDPLPIGARYTLAKTYGVSDIRRRPAQR